jgi:hypothetical protein
LLVRWLPSDEGLLLVNATPLTAAQRERVLQTVAALAPARGGPHTGLRRGEIIHRNLPTLLHALLQQQRDRRTGVTLDGDPVIFARAHFRVLQRQDVLSTLARHRSFEARPDETFLWYSGVRRKPPLAGQRVVLGRVLFEGDRLVLETNARARLRRGRAVVDRALGAAVTHLLDEYRDAQADPAPPPPDPRSLQRPPSRTAAPPPRDRASATSNGGLHDSRLHDSRLHDSRLHDSRLHDSRLHDSRFLGGRAPGGAQHEALDAAVGAHVRRHLRSWLSQPLPLLNDQTPRQAVVTPALRRRVVTLLEELEERLAGEVLSTSFFVELRQELGLMFDE